MTRRAWVAALLILASASPIAVTDHAVGQVADYGNTSLLSQGACEVFGKRGLIDDATRRACCRAYNVACPPGTQGGFGGGASQSQGFGGAADVGQSVAGGAAAGAANPSAQDRTSAGRAQSAVDAISALGGGSSGAEPNAPQGWSGDRNANTRTPEQDYAVKTNPYFFEGKSKYYK